MAKLLVIEKKDDGPDLSFYCPGCKCYHGIWINESKHNKVVWAFNGDMDKPTISPSVKVTIPAPEGMKICHSVITYGKINFLTDCTHELAGQTVDMHEEEDFVTLE